ncbi:MAG: DUF4838 domain-containing protein, partial [Verrucomicrobia bacterium]|nr:DUF4838 domain-containing protein [Verrucomicrobiota bacterium]
CSSRDLPLDLYRALLPKGIKLMLYLPCQVPNEDAQAQKAFGLPQGKKDQPIDLEFAAKWSEVIQEWADRYGDKVAGWWFDGGYKWVGFNDAIASKYAAAVKHGNPRGIVTLNPGISLVRHSEAEDYTAGELGEPLAYVPTNRWVKGSQWHALTYIGSTWAARDTRYTDDQWAKWVSAVVAGEGVVTLDMGPNWNPEAGPIGSFSDKQVKQVKAIRTTIYDRKSMRLTEDGRPRASILIPASASASPNLAALELQYCLWKISGATLPIRVLDRSFSGIRIQLDGAEFKEVQWQMTPDKLNLRRYEYVVEFSPGGVVLMGRDSADCTGVEINYAEASGQANAPAKVRLPGMFDDQGTLRAAYDFLERFCGVRFYGPKADSVIIPKHPTLEIQPANLRREPAIQHSSGSQTYDWPIMRAQYGNPSGDELALFSRRLRWGGIPWLTNHTLHGYPTRFPRAQFPEFYAGSDKLCYSSLALAKRVAQDAADYFVGKEVPGLQLPKNSIYYPVVPEDSARFCQCAQCKALLEPCKTNVTRSVKGVEMFNDGRASLLWFTFVNRIAAELKKTHPDKYISTLAYENYFWHPGIKVESNVAVNPCLGIKNHWNLTYRRNELAQYQKWVEDKRPTFLWNYYCFPEEPSVINHWKCFPGFMIHYEADMIQRYARDGILGVFLCGIGEQVDYYLTLKLYDNPTANVDTLLDEFFQLYFGKAAGPMKRFYTLIEETYSKPENWPQDGGFHQTEALAWGTLGTEARMAQLKSCMDEAVAADVAPVIKARIERWRVGVLEYMVSGRKAYFQKQEPQATRP